MVDDDPINVEVLRVRLSAQGYEVVTAIDGEDGLQRARELEPDLVLLDVMMPKLDGISVLKELKADITLRFMPVILLTATAPLPPGPNTSAAPSSSCAFHDVI